ncbi:RNA ligase (ATP) [Anaerolineales bacterium HSG24]|nr:RNA ligase (ATP) [Anaerolineales bacterium HSG24]
MRKLASIQKIKDIQPIVGADMIEKATVLGWQLVVKKGEFQVGDACIYCEIDSILPEEPAFEFLRPRHFRIKTVKLRGQISQGIAFPLTIIENHEQMSLAEGTDVTELIGVTKYEPPISINMKGQVKGSFPGFIPKTDETRIQSVPDILTNPDNQGKQCYITEKVDGTSATYYLNEDDFGVCSRNLDLLETEKNVHWMAARQADIETKLRSVGRNIAIQGEIIGPGVQGNKYKLPQHKLLVFNVVEIDDYRYLNYADFVSLIDQIGLETVPILTDDYCLGQDDVNGLVALSTAKSVVNSKTHREGIVIRPLIEAQDSELGRLSFKVINPKFLLKFE